jgi:hypothetical protein
MQSLSHIRQTNREEYDKMNKTDLTYRVITNKPKTPPLIDLSKLLNGEIKLSENNPKLRLSIEDYNVMRENNDIKVKIARLLNTDIKSLTAYSKKNVKKSEKHIDLSKMIINQTIKAKSLPIKTLISDLPDDVVKIITNKYKTLLEYKLRDWIPHRKLTIALDFISLNPNAIDFLSMPDNKKYINYSKLCENTNSRAIELLKEEIRVNPDNPDINWQALSKNPYAIDILDKHRNKIEMRIFSGNTNPKAIQIIKELRLLARGNASSSSSDNNIDWINMSANTSTEAIEFLNLPENYNKIEWDIFSANTNPKAIEMLIAKESEEFDLEVREFNRLKPYEKISWRELSKNPEAISLLEKKWEEEKELMRNDRREYNKLKKIGYIIDWTALSVNVKAIDLLRRKIDEENKLSKAKYDKLEDIEKINWWVLSANPKAIQLLEANRDKINWVQLGKNPKAIKLLEEELQVRPQNIYWYSISRNPEAGKLLKYNPDKIVWSIFSENPKAGEFLNENPKDGELLKDRIEFEDTLTKKKYNEISDYNKLNWYSLAKNPSIFYIN